MTPLTQAKGETTGHEPRKHPARRRKTAGAARIRSKELPAFTRQFSALLSAGLSMVATLDALEEQTDNENLKRIVQGLRAAIEGGASFSESLRAYPDVFNPLYVNMMHAGESSGRLPETARRVASFLQSSARLRRKVKAAMAYPVVVLTISLLIATLMIIFIVPAFASMYQEFDQGLPGPTQFLLSLSYGIRSHALLVIGLLAVLVLAFRRWKSTARGALAVDRFVLRVPVLGMLQRKVAVSRFARTFAQLCTSGIPILNALDIVAGATGSAVFERTIRASRTGVERGEPLSAALVHEPAFPRLLIHMLAAGEKTGRVDEMMADIADFYDEEVEAMLEGLMSLLEPLLIVLLGLIIGSIVVCMFLPIFGMHNLMQNF